MLRRSLGGDCDARVFARLSGTPLRVYKVAFQSMVNLLGVDVPHAGDWARLWRSLGPAFEEAARRCLRQCGVAQGAVPDAVAIGYVVAREQGIPVSDDAFAHAAALSVRSFRLAVRDWTERLRSGAEARRRGRAAGRGPAPTAAQTALTGPAAGAEEQDDEDYETWRLRVLGEDAPA